MAKSVKDERFQIILEVTRKDGVVGVSGRGTYEVEYETGREMTCSSGLDFTTQQTSQIKTFAAAMLSQVKTKENVM